MRAETLRWIEGRCDFPCGRFLYWMRRPYLLLGAMALVGIGLLLTASPRTASRCERDSAWVASSGLSRPPASSGTAPYWIR
jgi:hypothetical protein